MATPMHAVVQVSRCRGEAALYRGLVVESNKFSSPELGRREFGRRFDRSATQRQSSTNRSRLFAGRAATGRSLPQSGHKPKQSQKVLSQAVDALGLLEQRP